MLSLFRMLYKNFNFFFVYLFIIGKNNRTIITFDTIMPILPKLARCGKICIRMRSWRHYGHFLAAFPKKRRLRWTYIISISKGNGIINFKYDLQQSSIFDPKIYQKSHFIDKFWSNIVWNYRTVNNYSMIKKIQSILKDS